jgi:hypothetical protein
MEDTGRRMRAMAKQLRHPERVGLLWSCALASAIRRNRRAY